MATDEPAGAAPGTDPAPTSVAAALAAPQAQALDLSRQRLRELPAGLEKLQHLRHLDLSDNRLSSLDGFPDLRNLESLDLSWNELTTVPAQLLTQLELQEVTLTGNHFDNPLLARQALEEFLPGCRVVL